MKNVLFIAYYFPPMGGSGVQRPLKFVKYLRQFGWNPIVVCPEPGLYSHFDESLADELKEIAPDIYRVKAKTLFHSTGSDSKRIDYIPDFITQKIRRVQRLFLFPDNKKGWISPAVKECFNIITKTDVDLIYSTAPPFSNHIAASEVSKQSGIPLVLDYRDAWLNNHFMDEMFDWQKKKMKKLEKSCLKQASGVTGLDQFMLKGMKEVYGKQFPECKVISHGYDADDFKDHTSSSLDYQEGKLNILYSGLFYESNQPDVFLKGVSQAIRNGYFSKGEVHLHFQGGIEPRVKRLIQKLGLADVCTNYGYLPHQKAVANLKKADLLWMISNFSSEHKQIKSGKLFEYIGSQKPILGILHKGAAAEILQSYGGGFVAKVDSAVDVATKLHTIHDVWKKGELPAAKKDYVEQFDRKGLTGELAAFFDEISSMSQPRFS
ncbi:MAG: glycosyltransferase family 4 protein [Balneolaceae bacterium]|nr:glycosyltransferase family 4 protein [Balneolaceae bacterium]